MNDGTFGPVATICRTVGFITLALLGVGVFALFAMGRYPSHRRASCTASCPSPAAIDKESPCLVLARHRDTR